MTKIFSTLGGRKLTVIVFSLLIIAVVGIVRDLPGETLINAVLTLAGIGAGAIALEDGAKAIGGKHGKG